MRPSLRVQPDAALRCARSCDLREAVWQRAVAEWQPVGQRPRIFSSHQLAKNAILFPGSIISFECDHNLWAYFQPAGLCPFSAWL